MGALEEHVHWGEACRSRLPRALGNASVQISSVGWVRGPLARWRGACLRPQHDSESVAKDPPGHRRRHRLAGHHIDLRIRAPPQTRPRRVGCDVSRRAAPVCARNADCAGIRPTLWDRQQRDVRLIGARSSNRCLGCERSGYLCWRSAGRRCGVDAQPVLPVLVDLKATDSVRAIGLSNHDAAEVDAAERTGERAASNGGCRCRAGTQPT